jgi:membrane protein implicated in regulation of membrane protease activity
MTLLWWHWLVFGLLLVLAEMAAPGGFYIIFFGIAAIIVGVLALAGLGGPSWMQWLLFSVLAIVSLFFFRNRLLKVFQGDPQAPPVDQLVGEIATAAGELAPGAVGRVELRGAVWNARNDSAAVLTNGARCRVLRVDGLLLYVGPEGAWK